MWTVSFLLINILIGVDSILPSFVSLLVNSSAAFLKKKKDPASLLILFSKFHLSSKHNIHLWTRFQLLLIISVVRAWPRRSGSQVSALWMVSKQLHWITTWVAAVLTFHLCSVKRGWHPLLALQWRFLTIPVICFPWSQALLWNMVNLYLLLFSAGSFSTWKQFLRCCYIPFLPLLAKYPSHWTTSARIFNNDLGGESYQMICILLSTY